MVTAAAGASARTIVEIGSRLISKLSPHISKFTRVGAEVTGEAASLAANATDNGQAASVFNGRQFLTDLGILFDLSNFQVHLPSLNGQVTDAQKGLIAQIINSLRTSDGEISASQARDLFKTITDVTVGNGTSSTSEPPHAEPKDHAEGERSDTGTKTEDDTLFDPIKKILRRELLNKSSWLGLTAEVAKQTGFGSIEGNVEGFIDQHLLTDKFKEALKNSILGEETNIEGFTTLQSKAFKVASWVLWGIDKLPSWSIQYFPLATTIIKFSMPIWSHIPFLRKPLGTLYPVIDEVAGFLGKFQDETKAIKDAICKMRGDTQVQDSVPPAPEVAK